MKQQMDGAFLSFILEGPEQRDSSTQLTSLVPR